MNLNPFVWLARIMGENAVIWLFFICLVAVGGAGGWTINGWRWEARLAALERQHALEQAETAKAVANAVENVRALERQGDDIAARLMKAEADRRKLAKEKDDAIQELTTGRACLDAGLVRLLNGTNGSGAGLRLPQTSGGVALADRTIAANSIDAARRAAEPSQGADRPHGGQRSAIGASVGVVFPADTRYARDIDVALWAREARDRHDECRGRIDTLRTFYQLGEQP